MSDQRQAIQLNERVLSDLGKFPSQNLDCSLKADLEEQGSSAC